MEIIINNVNILNVGHDVFHGSIRIKDGVIEEISQFNISSSNSMVIDGEDDFLLPGFIDLHTHILAKGFHKQENMANPLSIHFYNGVLHALQTINAGVTTIRDCGSADLGVKLAQIRGLFPSPKMEISVTPLVTTGGHFDLFLPSGFDLEIMYPGFPKGRCDGVEEVLKKTREVKRAGADFIKIMASGGVLTTNTSPDAPQFNLKELKTIVNEAKADNLKVSAHCHSQKGIDNCIEVGIDSIEHGTFLNAKLANRMVEKNISLIPTLLVHHYLYKNGFPKWDTYQKEKSAKLKEIVKVQKENVEIAYQKGVNILMGTDSGVIPHGHNLEELKYLVDIGMSPSEAIASGTCKAAQFLNKNNLGSIQHGKVADLILVKGNPLDNINVLTDNDNILAVIQDGKIIKGH